MAWDDEVSWGQELEQDARGIHVDSNRRMSYREAENDVMRNLIDDTRRLGPQAALQVHLDDPTMVTPQYIMDSRRANFLTHIPCKQGTTLAADLGSGFGTVSRVLAHRYGHVLSADASYERLLFSKSWFDWEGVQNVSYVCSDLGRLDLGEDRFDLIVLNGVLEWTPFEAPSLPPEQVQRRILSQAYDALKPGGTLYVGIENRYALDALAGHPDPHTGIRFHSVVPRFVANFLTRLFRNARRRPGVPVVPYYGKYLNYTYARPGYRKLLAGAGFGDVRFRVPLPSYNRPFRVTDDHEEIGDYFSRIRPYGMLRLFSILWPVICFHLSPGFSIYATKKT
ncbi:MAG: class I SAM-dependent methyltransferase [Alphaproteobacteria bacterium]